MEFTDQERALLRIIQRDCSLSLSELAAQCGMAQSTVWRKLQEFENAGLIRARVALLDPDNGAVRGTWGDADFGASPAVGVRFVGDLEDDGIGAVRDAALDDYRFRSIVLGIVASPTFQMRIKSETPTAEVAQVRGE